MLKQNPGQNRTHVKTRSRLKQNPGTECTCAMTLPVLSSRPSVTYQIQQQHQQQHECNAQQVVHTTYYTTHKIVTNSQYTHGQAMTLFAIIYSSQKVYGFQSLPLKLIAGNCGRANGASEGPKTNIVKKIFKEIEEREGNSSL